MIVLTDEKKKRLIEIKEEADRLLKTMPKNAERDKLIKKLVRDHVTLIHNINIQNY